MASLVLIISLVSLILLGAPIAVAMVMLPTIYILWTGVVPLSAVPYQMYEAIAHYPLVAIPFFMLTGELMNNSTITVKLIDLSRAMIGRLRGGLAQINIVTSMLFAGMNGSAVADTATVGSLLIPAMKRAGYPAPFSAAITATSATIGGIIPPSVAMVILASSASLSVGALFAGGIVPGILIGLLLMIVTLAISIRNGYERSDAPFSLPVLMRALWGSAFALLIPVLLVGGILGGIFSSVEAGAVTAMLSFLVGTFLYRGMSWAGLSSSFVRAMKLSASVFIIIAAAGPFSWLLARLGTLGHVEGWLLGYVDDRLLFVLFITVFILLAGMIMDGAANIIILGPMLIDACVSAGFDSIQASLVVVVGFLLGTVTPPVGVSFFVSAHIAGARLEHVAKALVPFLAVEVFVLILMFVAPPITLWLPRMFGFIS